MSLFFFFSFLAIITSLPIICNITIIATFSWCFAFYFSFCFLLSMFLCTCHFSNSKAIIYLILFYNAIHTHNTYMWIHIYLLFKIYVCPCASWEGLISFCKEFNDTIWEISGDPKATLWMRSYSTLPLSVLCVHNIAKLLVRGLTSREPGFACHSTLSNFRIVDL